MTTLFHKIGGESYPTQNQWGYYPTYDMHIKNKQLTFNINILTKETNSNSDNTRNI